MMTFLRNFAGIVRDPFIAFLVAGLLFSLAGVVGSIMMIFSANVMLTAAGIVWLLCSLALTGYFGIIMLLCVTIGGGLR